MATGDSTDLLARLRTLIPGGWTAILAPMRDAVLGGLADALSGSYALIGAVRAQTRIGTASGWFLDLIGWDFFRERIMRRRGEQDDDWRARIIKEILRERVTGKGISQALLDLTGRRPILVEPWNPNENAAYGYSFYGHDTYGSLALNNQFFVTAFRPKPKGIADAAGYNYGYYGAPTTPYIGKRQIKGAVPDNEIYAMVRDTKAEGTTAWVAIQ